MTQFTINSSVVSLLTSRKINIGGQSGLQQALDARLGQYKPVAGSVETTRGGIKNRKAGNSEYSRNQRDTMAVDGTTDADRFMSWSDRLTAAQKRLEKDGAFLTVADIPSNIAGWVSKFQVAPEPAANDKTDKTPKAKAGKAS